MTPPLLSAPIVHPQRGPLPVLLSVPHSGRDYPDWLLEMARGGRDSLSRLEDPLVDRLVWRALRLGCGAVIARAPRAAVDCNRGEDEVDPTVIADARPDCLSPRARGGLGIVPARTRRDGYLWRRSISKVQLDERLVAAHRPYHRAIAEELDRIRRNFGCALLIDCHSMPPPRTDGGPTLVVGDLHGRAADATISAKALASLRAQGHTALHNEPFAGGYVVERHGRPQRDIHAIQLEIDRRLYLDRAFEGPGPGFDAIARVLAVLALDLGEFMLDQDIATAAE